MGKKNKNKFSLIDVEAKHSRSIGFVVKFTNCGVLQTLQIESGVWESSGDSPPITSLALSKA